MTYKTNTLTITPTQALLAAAPSLARLLATGQAPSKGAQIRAASAYAIMTSEDEDFRDIMAKEWVDLADAPGHLKRVA